MVGAAPTPTLGVIATFHDLAPFVPTALASMRASADPRITWVLVDDGSSDATPELLTAGARTLPNARVLRFESALGPAAARNRAMAELDTDWITFFDGDDWAVPGWWRYLLDECARLDADFVRVDQIHAIGRERTLVRVPDGTREGRVGDPRDSILPGTRSTAVDYPWSWAGAYSRRLYERGLLDFPEHLRTAEDRPWIWRLHLQAESFSVLDRAGVFYRRDVTTSLTRRTDDRRLDILPALELVRRVLDADRDPERFEPKFVRTVTGMIAWHHLHRDELARPLQRRLMLGSAALLDTLRPAALATALQEMPASRAAAIRAVRRGAERGH